MRSAGNASIFSIRVLLSAGISVPSTRLLVAFYQHTPPLPMPRPVSRHRAREGADRWSGDIRSFPGCAGLSGKNVLARLTGPGLAANDLQSSCADLFRLSTPSSQPLQGVDGRHKAGQDEIGDARSLPLSPRDFPRTALRFLRAGCLANLARWDEALSEIGS